MNIPFLSLKDVTSLHGEEICAAVTRVVQSGWYLQGKENEQFEKHYSEYKERKINKKQLAEALEISRPTLDKLLRDKGYI